MVWPMIPPFFKDAYFTKTRVSVINNSSDILTKSERADFPHYW